MRRWSTWREAVAVCLESRNLLQSLALALVVGTILSLINQSGPLFSGQATRETWIRIALTYLVPFLVSNYGLLVGSRSRP